VDRETQRGETPFAPFRITSEKLKPVFQATAHAGVLRAFFPYSLLPIQRFAVEGNVLMVLFLRHGRLSIKRANNHSANSQEKDNDRDDNEKQQHYTFLISTPAGVALVRINGAASWSIIWNSLKKRENLRIPVPR
jgi:hypothetical protein